VGVLRLVVVVGCGGELRGSAQKDEMSRQKQTAGHRGSGSCQSATSYKICNLTSTLSVFTSTSALLRELQRPNDFTYPWRGAAVRELHPHD
jgi:hypothetical protein